MPAEILKLEKGYLEYFTSKLVKDAAGDIDRSFLINQERDKSTGIRVFTQEIKDLLAYPNRMYPATRELLTELGLTDRLALTVIGTEKQDFSFKPAPRFSEMEVKYLHNLMQLSCRIVLKTLRKAFG